MTDKYRSEENSTSGTWIWGQCRNCRTRPATKIWVGEGGALALVHGGGTRWCERCVVLAQLDYAKKAAARLDALGQRLKEIDAAEKAGETLCKHGSNRPLECQLCWAHDAP